MASQTSTTAEFLVPEDPRWATALGKVRHDFFHLPGYLKACAAHEEGDPLLFLLDAGSHGMLIPVMKRSLACFGPAYQGFHDAISPYGYPGPVCWGEGYPAALPDMLRELDRCLQHQRIVSLFLRLNPFLGPPAALLAPFGTVQTHGPTIYLDLRDREGSWRSFNAGNRRFITRMLNFGCSVRIDQWETMDQVVMAYQETMTRLGAASSYFFQRSYFEQLRRELPEHFHLATSLTPEGAVTGGVFFTEVGGLIHYFLTGTFAQYTLMSPSKLLVNALREWGLAQGHHTLHLGGGLGARLDNLYQFKIRLSKSVTTFSTFSKILLPEVYQALARDRMVPGSAFFPSYRALPQEWPAKA